MLLEVDFFSIMIIFLQHNNRYIFATINLSYKITK